MQLENPLQKTSRLHLRIQVWHVLLLAVMGIFILRLFYLQVIRYNYYSSAALAGQLKEYEIPAVRGAIFAHNSGQRVPLVLNETLYTLFADPKFIDEPFDVAAKVQSVIGGKTEDYEKSMGQDTRYAVLAKKLTRGQKNQIVALDIKGLGTRDEPHRTYPQGTLASQLLGFVNDEGDGKYGVEQHLNKQLKGEPGRFKSITDAQGIPLLSDPTNVGDQPKEGQSLLLTVDLSIQRQLEDILKAGLKKSNSKSGGALIIDPYNGAIKAMANYPSYDPAKFYEVKDANVFNNAVVGSPLEVGSVMKAFTAAAALNQGVVSPNTKYYDPSQFKIDNYTIKNIEEDGGAGTRSVADILQLSLNTGATWLLMQMGGGEINSKARNTWHDYMVNHYQFGRATGVEQGYEAAGSIPDPNKGFGLNLQYANTAFGQGMTATPLQLAGALSATLNGGTYFRPRLVEGYIENGKEIKKNPEIVKQGVVKPSVSIDLQALMQHVINKNYLSYGMRQQPPAGYIVGGKTGTAEIANPAGGYYEDRFNGTFIGFVGGSKPQYVIVVRVNEPRIQTYAGAGAAAPIFSNLTEMLINGSFVPPK